MSILNAIFLGFVQGVAEFLPISSSGHLAVLQNVFNLQTAEEGHMFFDVLLHFGTLISIMIVYWKDIVYIVSDTVGLVRSSHDTFPEQRTEHPGARMLLMLFFGTLPLFIILPFHDSLEQLYYKTGFIGAAYAFSTREHMSLTLIRDKFTGKAHTALLVVIDGLILLMAIFVFTIGGFKLAVSASREFSALLGIPRSLVYSIAPISGVFIVLAQIINIYEDVTGEKVESKEGADK